MKPQLHSLENFLRMVTMYYVSLRNQTDLGLIDSAFTKCSQFNPVDLYRMKVQILYYGKSPKVSNALKYCLTLLYQKCSCSRC